ncbi:hypothetical protein F4825DRAFT_93991 [Nemania diffusa]|nr:hypothetical protein F4825DRAFT_93991 [Nemania diffusa]
MAPPCRVFPASQLPAEIQVDDGKRRKGTAGSGRIDLEACELLAMLQYDCLIDKAPGERESTVKCLPVQRWFRRCQDRKGNFMVETTMWEERTDSADKEPRNGRVGDAARGGA